MFNYKFKAVQPVKKFNEASLLTAFLYDDDNLKDRLKEFEKEFGLQLSNHNRKPLLAKSGSVVITKEAGQPEIINLFKVKIDEKFSNDYFRNFFTGFVSTIEKLPVQNLYIKIPNYADVKKYFVSEEYFYQTFVEGLFYGNYKFDKYKTNRSEKANLNVFLTAENIPQLENAIANGFIAMEGVNFTKDLQNEPAINLSPKEFANRLKKELSCRELKVTVFDEKEIAKRKMNGLIAVGKGSINPPQFIVLHYKPSVISRSKEKKRLRKIALVGKGIMFDSGGISLKPAADMWQMKADMSGAAVVAGTLLSALKMKLPVELYGIIPAAENMPSGSALKPGDIITTASGKTVEVDNTDAEGRIILADALHYASQLKPDMIVDLATLTGGCVVALGEFVAGLFTKDESLADEIYKSGLTTYDRVWRLPLWDDYDFLNESDVADVKNIGGRWGSAITAAKFLENFVDKSIPWAHIDIAGPACPNKLNNYTKPYMTGFGVRLLLDYITNQIKN